MDGYIPLQVLTMMKEQLDERTAAVEKLMRERRKLREQRDRAASLTATLIEDNAALKQQACPGLAVIKCCRSAVSNAFGC